MQTESERLESIAAKSLYAAGINENAIRHCFGVFRRWFAGSTMLEMGPAEGIMTGLLIQTGLSITVVEGSAQFCDQLRSRYPGIEVAHALFEEFTPARRFDNIVIAQVLEHVQDPTVVLRRAAAWLSPGGRILASVPNSRSLHRQAAAMMGLLTREDELNALDLHHGHRRVFNPESFRACFSEAGLRIAAFGGYWLKPVSNAQIEASWTPAMLEAFMQLGERYPDIAAEIYVVAE